MQFRKKLMIGASVMIAAMLFGMPLYVMTTTVSVSSGDVATQLSDAGEGGIVNLDPVPLTMPEDNTLTVKIDDYFHSGWDSIFVSKCSNLVVDISDGAMEFVPNADWFGHEDVTVWAVYTLTGTGSATPSPSSAPLIPVPPGPIIGPDTVVEERVFNVEVTPVNDPPVLNIVRPILFRMTTDTTFDLRDILAFGDIFRDVDSIPQYSYVGGTGIADLVITDNRLISVTAYDATGDGALTVRVADQGWEMDYTFYVRVVPRDSIGMYEDTVLDTDLDTVLGIPFDHYEIAESSHVGTSVSAAPGADPVLTLTPEPDWYGSDVIQIHTFYNPDIAPTPPDAINLAGNGTYVPGLCMEIGCFDCDVSVYNVNDPPTVATDVVYGIDMTVSTDFAPEQPFDLGVLFSDPDSSLTYSWMTSSGLVTPRILNGELLSISSGASAGSDTVTIIASDGEYVATYDMPVNVVPRQTVSMDEDTSASLALSDYADPLSQVVDVRGSDHITTQAGTGQVTLVPEANWYGSEPIMITAYPMVYGIDPPILPVIDSAPPGSGINPPEPQTYTIECYDLDVSVASVNDPPVLQALPPVTMTEDQTLTDAVNLSQYASDIDSDFSFTVSAAGQALDPTLDHDTLTIAPAADWFGTGTVTVTVSDGEYAVSRDMEVKVTPVNDPPRATDVPATLGTDEDTPVTINLADYVEDIDSPLWFSALCQGDNATVEVNETDWNATVIPAADWSGTLDLTVYASDGSYDTAREISVDVMPVNDPPVLLDERSVDMAEDSSTVIDLGSMFYDVDSQLQYMAYSGSGDLRCILSGSTLEVEPAVADWYGTDTVVVVATDGQYSVVAPLRVDIAPVNDAPRVTAPAPDISMDEDTATSLLLAEMFTDADGDGLTYTLETGPGMNATLDEATGLLTLVPLENWNGDTFLTVYASDGVDTATMNLTVSVEPVNDPPVLAHALEPVQMDSGGTFTLDLSDAFDDPEGGDIQVTVSGATDLIIRPTDARGIFTLTAPDDLTGSRILTVTATDGVSTVKTDVPVLVIAPDMELAASSANGTGDIATLAWLGIGLVAVVALAMLATRGVPLRRRRNNIL